MRKRRTRRVAIDDRQRKQRLVFETTAAIARTIASCEHNYGPDGWDALCTICDCIRPRKTK